MEIKKVWFDQEYIYGIDEEGRTLRQSLLWYPRLAMASDKERESYQIGFDGIHWRNLDEDISFESFSYEDAEPTALQKFFLTHKELNIAELQNSLVSTLPYCVTTSMGSRSHLKKGKKRY